jgi:hypothetical protein
MYNVFGDVNPFFCRQDLSLPHTLIMRLAKGMLPPNTQIQKDAQLAISKSATVFVSFIADELRSFSPFCPFLSAAAAFLRPFLSTRFCFSVVLFPLFLAILFL